MVRGRLLGLIVLTSLVAGAAPAAASTLTVAATGDVTGAGPGTCSLRDAIQAVDSPGSANGDCAPAAFGANTIVLPAGFYVMGGPNEGQELSIGGTVSNLTIEGAGESQTTIDGNILGNRLFQIAPSASVTIESLTITGGHAPGGAQGMGGPGLTGQAGGPGADGGAILNEGSLTLTDAAVTDNVAGQGGAGGSSVVSGSPPAPGGEGAAGGDGGAIFNSGNLVLSDVTISGNQAGPGGGGGVGGSSGGVNPSGVGGAGGAGGAGGGVANDGGTLIISDSTIRGNGAGVGGSGGAGGPGGPPMASPTSIGGAGGAGAPGGDGGGVWSSGGSLSITNSTIVSNSTGSGGGGGVGGNGQGVSGTGGAGGSGGGAGVGGGLAVSNSAGSPLLSLTLAGNQLGQAGMGAPGGAGQAASAAGAPGSSGDGGGVAGVGSAVVLEDSLLALDAGGNCSPSTVIDGGHNLSFGDQTCPASFASGNPNLGPLQNNGGPTQTISLQPGSAAIDQIPATGSGCPATDQRGVPRPSGPACDIGAYEVAPPLASTGAASAISGRGATIAGSVTANAGSANVRVQYGRTTSYGSLSAVVHVAGVIKTPVSIKLRNLKTGVRYHYWIVVQSMDGTARGADMSFVAIGPPAIRALRISPASMRAGERATVTYTDTQSGRTTLTVARLVAGVVSGRRCPEPVLDPLRRVSGCERLVAVGSFTHRDRAGRNRLRLPLRFGRRKLTAGDYRLLATPSHDGRAGASVSASFTIA